MKQPRMTAEARKQANQLAARRRWEKFRAANPEHLAAYRKRWAALHPEKEREYDRRQRENVKKDPRRLALHQARQERYREKRNARKRQRYRDDPAYAKKERARLRLWAQQNYAQQYRPEGKRKCTLCGLPGHNRVRCSRVSVASHCHDTVNTLTGGGGAPPVEYGTPPPAVVGALPVYLGEHRHTGGADRARIAELRALVASGRYVPFAALRAEFAGVAAVPSEPSEWTRERNRRRYERRSSAEAAP